jgi:hypothetical protein
MTQPRIIVASDLEGTLTTGETWKGIARYLERNWGEQTSLSKPLDR